MSPGLAEENKARKNEQIRERCSRPVDVYSLDEYNFNDVDIAVFATTKEIGKRYIKKLVEDGIVDGWDDPRLVSIAALRRRGFTPESIKMFVELCGISKANSSVDYAMLEYCIREDLKLKKNRVMAVLDPVKLIIDNYPEGQIEYLDADNSCHLLHHQHNERIEERYHIQQDQYICGRCHCSIEIYQ